MKRGILLITVVLMCLAGMALAEEGKLSGTIDVTYVSRYIFRGIDTYREDHSAIQPSINLDLYGTGFGIGVWMSQANGSGQVNNEEIRYTIHYGNSLFDAESYKIDYALGWTYYNFPDNPRKAKDNEEVFGAFSFPNLLPCGVVPSYTYIHVWQAEGGNGCGFRKCGGPLHVFGLGYDLAVPGFISETAEQILHLSAATVYNDGTYGAGVDNDWSHAVFGISTGFDIGNNLTFTPGFYYQSSWEDSVNTSDDYWTSLNLSYAF
ncbi:MAG: TorF family putative porin [Planctomycetota bacterium]